MWQIIHYTYSVKHCKQLYTKKLATNGIRFLIFLVCSRVWQFVCLICQNSINK